MSRSISLESYHQLDWNGRWKDATFTHTDTHRVTTALCGCQNNTALVGTDKAVSGDGTTYACAAHVWSYAND